MRCLWIHLPLLRINFKLNTGISILHSVVYQPAIAITVRDLVAQNERPNIEWPKSFQRYFCFSLDYDKWEESVVS